MGEAERGNGLSHPRGLIGSRTPGFPVRTLQKAQPRVQISPRIMKVAWRLAQHSPILGQDASSHTVVRRCSRSTLRVASKACAPGARTRIQSGFFRTGVAGNRAFSGWRGGPALRSERSSTVTMERLSRLGVLGR
jgi:hypothetical protein